MVNKGLTGFQEHFLLILSNIILHLNLENNEYMFSRNKLAVNY